MSSPARFVVYLAVLHLAVGGLAYLAFREQPLLLIGVEVLMILSAYLAYRLYRSLIAPVDLLARGAAALADQDFSVKLVPTGSREMDRVVRVYNQMIDQLRTERVSSRQREAFLDRLIEAAELGVLVLDFDGRVSAQNSWLSERAATAGFQEAVIDPLLAENTTQFPAEEATVLTGPGNRRYRVERSSFVDQGFERTFLVIHDVTAALVNAEKDAYGKVIRMMAHEVNNTNAAITSILRSLLSEAAGGGEELTDLSQEYLPVVIERVGTLTTFMSKLARVVRIPRIHRQPVDLNDLLRRSGSLMEQLLRDQDIELRYELAAGQVIVSADAALLEQVVINALTNARQSIGRNGRIVLSSQRSPAGLAVADDGPGIPPEIAPKLFTPFYSSKPTGQGIGLTLAREVLTAHGATFRLATEADGQTRFRVTFPS